MTHTRKFNTINKIIAKKGNGHKKKGGWLAPLAMAASSILPWAIDRLFPSKGSGKRKGKSITTPISAGPLA